MADQGPLAEQQLSQATKQQSLRRPIRWAIGIHIVIILVAMIGLPHWRRKDIDLSKAVSVDLVAPTGEFSAAPNKTKTAKPFVPNSKPKEQTKPPVANPDKPPQPVASDDAKKEDIKKPDDQDLAKPKTQKVEKTDDKVKLDKADKKKKQKKEEKQKAPEEFNSVLKNLLGAPDSKDAQPDGNPIDEVLDKATKEEGSAPVTSDVLALSEMDALKYQLAKCWNVPSGAMNAQDLIVDIRVEVNPDRTVRTAEIVDTGRYDSDDFFRAAADSAKRALFNPLCTPLALPQDKYDVWKSMLIRFNPRDMFGG